MGENINLFFHASYSLCFALKTWASLPICTWTIKVIITLIGGLLACFNLLCSPCSINRNYVTHYRQNKVRVKNFPIRFLGFQIQVLAIATLFKNFSCSSMIVKLIFFAGNIKPFLWTSYWIENLIFKLIRYWYQLIFRTIYSLFWTKQAIW